MAPVIPILAYAERVTGRLWEYAIRFLSWRRISNLVEGPGGTKEQP